MKTNILITILATILVTGCQPKEQDKTDRPVDLESVNDSISLVMDNYYKAFNSKNLETYSTLLADDGLFCGTDPGEFWNKKEVVDLMKQQFADTSFNWQITSDRQEIKVSSDGNSAIVVNQFLITEISPKIPMREITHLTNTDNRWLISFTCYNFITANENVENLNTVLQ
ncbi:MAG TPA: nuclear transport factor 2 family protein [Gillisia sp.]|nr:nuclear transport factor 2 family protein [Gillisia sp.]